MWTFVDAQGNASDLGEYSWTFNVTAGGAERKFAFAFGCRVAVNSVTMDFVRTDSAAGTDVPVIQEIQDNNGASGCMAWHGYFTAAQLADVNDTTITIVTNLSANSIRAAACLWESAESALVLPPFDSAEDSDPVNGGAASQLDLNVDVPADGSILGWAFAGDVGGSDAFTVTGITEDEQAQVAGENARYLAAHTNGLSVETNRTIQFTQSGAGTNLFSVVGISSAWEKTASGLIMPTGLQGGIHRLSGGVR